MSRRGPSYPGKVYWTAGRMTFYYDSPHFSFRPQKEGNGKADRLLWYPCPRTISLFAIPSEAHPFILLFNNLSEYFLYILLLLWLVQHKTRRRTSNSRFWPRIDNGYFPSTSYEYFIIIIIYNYLRRFPLIQTLPSPPTYPFIHLLTFQHLNFPTKILRGSPFILLLNFDWLTLKCR